MTAYLFVLLVGLAAGCVSGIVGTGASIMLLPVLVYAFGPQQAVPIMAVAAVLLNVARAAAWWREIDWKAFAAYAAAGMPAAALGARTLLVLPAHLVEVALGLFFIAMVPVRHWLDRRKITLRLWQLAIAAAFIGFLTGLVLSTGPLSVPAFLFYGLTKGAFLATEAASSLGLYVAKVVTFREFGALPLAVFMQGLLVGASLMAGTFAGKAVVLRMSPNLFRHMLDVLMLVAGVALLWTAYSR